MDAVSLTGRLVALREFRAEDAAPSLSVVGDDRVTWSLSFNSRDLVSATELIHSAMQRARTLPRPEFYLAVTTRADEFLGFVRLRLDGVEAGKLGYAIRADQWGKGYATDAARTMLDFGFGKLGLHRISAAIGPDNAASVAVVERLGMKPEGRIRDHVFTNFAWRDSLLYSILDSEWQNGTR